MLRWLLIESPLPVRLSLVALLGLAGGCAVRAWANRWTRILQSDGLVISASRTSWITLPAGLAALFVWYLAAVTVWGAQEIPEQGRPDWLAARILVHLLLIALLYAATVIDLRHYLIPDEVVIPGILLGLLAGLCISHVHLVPLWIDWNQEDPLSGPYIPEWMKHSPHLHGVGVAIVGGVTGALATWLVRELSTRTLGQEAMGLGDVTLMAMIGSVIGWQPVVFVLLISPLTGLAVGLLWRLTSGRTALPFGPFLSLGTVIVLCTWKWLWNPVRLVFGHVHSLASMAAIVIATLLVLLVGLRLYRTLPTR